MAVYLVTGGCGFIGSHLCEALIARGDSVRILDDLSTGSIENVRAGHLLLRGNVADPEFVASAMEGVVGCFHLAAVASVERSTRDWFGAHRTNLSGTIAVFDAARRIGRDRPLPVVYASSAAVYGDCKQLPIKETTQARPRSAYGADKYGCELHARIASEVFGVPTVGLRFFNVYGPRQNPASPYSGVISIFCDRLRRGLPIDVFGNGSQTRDFVFVSDVVNALLTSMNQIRERFAVFNVCTGKPTSVLELARLIAELCERQPEIRDHPPRAGEITHSLGDCQLIGRRLGLSNFVSLRSGLIHTLSWMEVAEDGSKSRFPELSAASIEQ
jgi:UDP-glucose 4-epimerase